MTKRPVPVMLPTIIVGFLLCSSAWPVMASTVLTCPLALPEHAIRPDRIPVGWKAKTREHARLDSAGMLHGPYDESGYLKPTTTTSRRQGTAAQFTEVWEFGPPPHYERWLVCGYGPLELFKRIDDDSLTRCTLTSTIDGGLVRAARLTCTKN